MFVISKLEISRNKNVYQMEHYERQTFYEFEKDQNSMVEIYKVHLDADPDFNIIATENEMKYFNDNKAQIKKLRNKSRMKEEEMCRSEVTGI